MSSQQKKLPAYCTTSVGPPGLGNIAIRLRDLAAFLAAQGHQGVAEHVSRAYGDLQAYLAVPIRCSPQVSRYWTESTRQAPQCRRADADRKSGAA